MLRPSDARWPTVQTFLPYPELERSAYVLDDRRLGKQRVECLQILHVLLGLRWNLAEGVIEEFTPRAWRSHPAVLMWVGHERTLLAYQRSVCATWVARGFNDTCYDKSAGLVSAWSATGGDGTATPPWLGDRSLHRSHQSNLVRKEPEIYRPHFPDVPDDLPYVWPVARPAEAGG